MIEKYVSMTKELVKIRKELAGKLSIVNITVSDYVILNDINSNPEASIRAISERVGIKPSSLSRIVPALEAADMIRRVHRSDEDLRVKRYIVTAKGKRALTRALRELEK